MCKDGFHSECYQTGLLEMLDRGGWKYEMVRWVSDSLGQVVEMGAQVTIGMR